MQENGITLVEVVAVIFIIVFFSMIIISDFPKIQRQYALSSSAYKLAQNLRKAQDLGMSGLQIKDLSGQPVNVKGYGVYVNTVFSRTKYAIYADVAGTDGNSDHKYGGNFDNTQLCSELIQPTQDCLVEPVIDITKQNSSLYIDRVNNTNAGTYTSVNFSPPNPVINIEDLMAGSEIGIVLGLTSDSSTTRTVKVNTSGLINTQ